MDSSTQSGSARRVRLERWALGVLLLITVLLRVVAVAQYEAKHPLAQHPVIDERSYVEWGTRIARGDWLGDEVFFQEPLYPYFIGTVYGVLGEDLHGLRLLQCLLGGLTALLIWAIARRACGPTAAWVAATAFALFPPAILLPCLLLKPNLFLPIFAGLVWLMLGAKPRARVWIGIGVLGGLGALLRGNLLIMLPFLALWPFLRARQESLSLRRALPGSAMFVAGAALVLLPVFFRNWVVGDQFALTTSGAGTNVYGGNNADNPYGVATEFDWVRGIPKYEAGDWRREAERRLDRPLDGSESSSYWLGQVLESMQADPALHLSIFWNKLRLALNDQEVPDNHHLGWDARYVSLLQAPWPGFSLWGGLALGGLLLAILRGQLRAERLQLALIFVLYLGTIVLTVMSMRARLPLVVVLFPFSGYLVAEIVRRVVRIKQSGQKDRLGQAVGCVLLGVSFAYLPVFNDKHLRQDLAERDYNLVVNWLETGEQPERAFVMAAELAAHYPRSSRLQILVADTEWRAGKRALATGERERGEQLIRDALARLQPLTRSASINPREQSRAYRLAAYIQADLGNWGSAERFFRSAREFAAEDLELLVSHGQALFEVSTGPGPQRSEARQLLQQVLDRAPDSIEALGARALLEAYE